MAHPGARGPDRLLDDDCIRALVDAGLAGLEIDHRDNPPAARERWADVACRYGLITTGSSDWHGAGKPNRPASTRPRLRQLQRILELARG